MLLRWYAAVSFGLVAIYAAIPQDRQGWVFLAITLGAVPAVLIGARRSPPGGRLPWWLLLNSLVVFNAGNVVWLYYVSFTDRGTGDGTVADLLFSVASLLTLGAALVVVIRRGRRDVGGVLDSVVTALAVGALIWSALLLPHLNSTRAPLDRQGPLFITVFVVIGALGAMLRVSLVASRRLVATWLLAAGLALTLVSHVVVTLFTDPETLSRPDWTNLPFLAAYAALGCAALHPTAAIITTPDAAPDDDLSVRRLTFLGCMTIVIPLIGGVRALLGLPTDGLLMAFGSIMVVGLVMIRIARLSAERRRAEHALHLMATSDALTGLPNRTACLDRVGAELSEPGLAVLFGDLDGFKPVNDRLGHAAGDALLVVVADRLRESVREQDMVSRFGGDEFVIICRDDDPEVAVDAICERIRTAIESPIMLGGELVWVGLSVGVAYATATSTTDDLIGRADLAMYAAKQSKATGRLSLALG
jgi:diguanylate cyclase (GGDEF)-like protein